MQVIVDKLLTNYESSGEGKTVLLLHGWGDSLKGLNELRRTLKDDYKVLAIDLPGFGGSQAPKIPWGLDEYVSFLSDFLLKISADPVYAIVAHSNGGAIAIRGLGSGKLEAKKCILLGSAGIRGTYKGKVRAIRLITKAGKALTTPLPKSAKNKLRKKVYSTVGSDMLVAEHLQETFKKVVTDDVRDDAANITQPTLLIYGENDDQAPPIYGREFHELMSNSTLEIVSDAGHFVHVDQSEKVNRLVKEFLK